MFKHLEVNELVIAVQVELVTLETTLCSGAFDNLGCHQIAGKLN